jgi:hypothetical protein
MIVTACCFLVSPMARGGTLSVTGSLDPNDANDVFLFPFTLAGTDLQVQSYGYGGTANAPGGVNAAGSVIPSGGFDPYLSLFKGMGSSATFLASNDDGLCPPGAPAPACADPTLLLSGLTAGPYVLALTVFDNFSFAENLGSGTLGDGFIGLGDYFDQASGTVRSSNFALDIGSTGAITPTPIPEPGALVLTGMVLVGALRFMNRRNTL